MSKRKSRGPEIDWWCQYTKTTRKRNVGGYGRANSWKRFCTYSLRNTKERHCIQSKQTISWYQSLNQFVFLFSIVAFLQLFFINDDEVFSKTEEFSPCEGDHYKLEVASDHYNLHWMFKGEYLLLYRFSRDNNTSKSSMLH